MQFLPNQDTATNQLVILESLKICLFPFLEKLGSIGEA